MAEWIAFRFGWVIALVGVLVVCKVFGLSAAAGFGLLVAIPFAVALAMMGYFVAGFLVTGAWALITGLLSPWTRPRRG